MEEIKSVNEKKTTKRDIIKKEKRNPVKNSNQELVNEENLISGSAQLS
jgi:hypothetical protein